jgi:AraC-like DNA-binding protein
MTDTNRRRCPQRAGGSDSFDPASAKASGGLAGATAQVIGEVLVERYRYLPGAACAGEMHVHEHWQWCLYVGGPGSYISRAGRVVFPSGTLTVIGPGEAHAAHDPEDRLGPSVCLVAYVSAEPAARFAGVVVDDRGAATAFARLWSAREGLDADVALTAFMARVGTERDRDQSFSPAPAALRTACEYLHEHATERVALAELAALVGLSRAHLVRAFARAYGLPPHRYQTALRIDRAKRLLAAGGQTIAEVAQAVGFADHAHFTRMFRRWVGFPPSRYANFVQDSQSPLRLDCGL